MAWWMWPIAIAAGASLPMLLLYTYFCRDDQKDDGPPAP